VVHVLRPEQEDQGDADASLQPLARDVFSDLHGSAAMEALGRRLHHIEHAAQRVARLAARPVIEDI
jgi:hypothetical protein